MEGGGSGFGTAGSRNGVWPVETTWEFRIDREEFIGVGSDGCVAIWKYVTTVVGKK